MIITLTASLIRNTEREAVFFHDYEILFLFLSCLKIILNLS